MGSRWASELSLIFTASRTSALDLILTVARCVLRMSTILLKTVRNEVKG